MRCGAAIVLALLFGSSVVGQTSREIVERGKAATALIEIEGSRHVAAATCVHESGVFITNCFVVDLVPQDGVLKLLLRTNTGDQQTIQAKVLRSNKDWDLAVLRATGDAKLPFLLLGDDAELIETANVTAFGFHLGSTVAPRKGELPDFRVNVGRITALRKLDGKLFQIELDANVNPGSSGGPVLDERGHVVGIFTLGVGSTAIPVSAVKNLLRNPEVVFQPPLITNTNRHEALEFTVEVTPLLDKLTDVSVDLELSQAGSKSRSFTATSPAKQNTYRIRAVPVPKPAHDAAARLNAKITYGASIITGQIEDREIKIGERTVKLSNVDSLRESGGLFSVTPLAGEPTVERVTGLESVDVDLGGYSVTLNLLRAKEVTLAPVTAL